MDQNFYQKVYAPDGSMFEVSHERAADLVLNKGWSNNPATAKKSAPKRAKKVRGAKVAPATEADNQTEDEPVDAPASATDDE